MKKIQVEITEHTLHTQTVEVDVPDNFDGPVYEIEAIARLAIDHENWEVLDSDGYSMVIK